MSSTEPALHPASGVRVAGAVATATAAPQRLMGRAKNRTLLRVYQVDYACDHDEMSCDGRSAHSSSSRVCRTTRRPPCKLRLQRTARAHRDSLHLA